MEKVHAKYDMIGPAIFTEDWQISATGQNSPSFMQRGPISLTGGAQMINFPRNYISAAGSNLCVFITPASNNPMFFNGFVSAQHMGSALLSAVSGFYVSGSGTDKGFWMSIGYK